MRKKFVLALVVLLGAFVVAYGVWWQFPASRNQEIVNQSYQVTLDHLKELSAQAEDPARNGFLNPNFLPYWGRLGMEQQESSPVAETVRSWAKYSTVAQSEKIDHRTLQTEGDEAYAEALEGMEGLAPELQAAMTRPLFLPPNYKLSAQSQVPNYIAARACAQAMTGLAEAQSARGESEQAAQNLVSVMQFGEGFYGQGTLMVDQIGASVQSMGIDGFNGLIDPNSDFSGDVWKGLSGAILESIPPQDTMLRALQGEILFCHNSLEHFAQNPEALGDGAFAHYGLLPGFYKREERIYNNLMSDLILQFQKEGAVTMPKEVGEFSTADWLTGKNGPVVKMLVPDFERAHRKIDLTRKSLAALATVTAVAAYRAEEGELPASLAQLSETGLPMVKDDDLLQTMDYKLEGERATLKVNLGQPTSGRTDVWQHPWLEVNDESLVYTFGP